MLATDGERCRIVRPLMLAPCSPWLSIADWYGASVDQASVTDPLPSATTRTRLLITRRSLYLGACRLRPDATVKVSMEGTVESAACSCHFGYAVPAARPAYGCTYVHAWSYADGCALWSIRDRLAYAAVRSVRADMYNLRMQGTTLLKQAREEQRQT